MQSTSTTPRLETLAVVLSQPERIGLSRVSLVDPGEADVLVDVHWSGISTGTEKLLYTGTMPPFPGMGYPLIPGYEAVGTVRTAGPQSGRRVGEQVFVPGARCFGLIRGLFGGAARQLVVPGAKVVPIGTLAEQGVLLALAATAWHALDAPQLPQLIIGHGVLGRLLARLVLIKGGTPPVVWERNPNRRGGAVGYNVLAPDDDGRRDYRSIIDVSGDPAILDTLVPRLARGGEIVLAGFYTEPVAFAFPPAFMREMRLRIAAEFTEADLLAVRDLAQGGQLSLDGLITHRQGATQAPDAYRTAFGDASCLKMIIDWRACP